MRLGIVSDTHGHLENTLAAVRMLESLTVDEVIHCGDIGTAEVASRFRPWPTHFVFGNCDHEQRELQAAIAKLGLTCHGRYGELQLANRHIAFLHSDDSALFHKTIESGKFDLVCYGHTHVARQERFGKTLVLNPGALYRANPHSLAIVELETMQATIIPL